MIYRPNFWQRLYERLSRPFRRDGDEPHWRDVKRVPEKFEPTVNHHDHGIEPVDGIKKDP